LFYRIAVLLRLALPKPKLSNYLGLPAFGGVAADFGRTNCVSAPPYEGDFDIDSGVNGTDLLTFALNFEKAVKKKTELISSPAFL